MWVRADRLLPPRVAAGVLASPNACGRHYAATYDPLFERAAAVATADEEVGARCAGERVHALRDLLRFASPSAPLPCVWCVRVRRVRSSGLDGAAAPIRLWQRAAARVRGLSALSAGGGPGLAPHPLRGARRGPERHVRAARVCIPRAGKNAFACRRAARHRGVARAAHRIRGAVRSAEALAVRRAPLELGSGKRSGDGG